MRWTETVRRSPPRSSPTWTGVSRERLRTWERRYGFPTPHRIGAGARRYAVDDVPRVVAVRRAGAQAVPLPDAIARARAATGAEPPAPRTLAGVVEQLPVPVAVVSGPAAMRSEEHTSELQSHSDLVCRLLLEKKKKRKKQHVLIKKKKKKKKK